MIRDVSLAEYRVVRKRRSTLKPSPENSELYGNPWGDSDILQLAESIQKRGLQEPLVITEDNYILSGHRRYTALEACGQVVVPCRVAPVRRDSMSRDDYIALLREHNRQRRKSVVEQMREELVDMAPVQAHAVLREQREKQLHGARHCGLAPLVIEGSKRRHGISSQKADHVKFIKQVVFQDRRSYWPLTVRGIHYPLLNYNFYRNIPRKLRYRNDDQSYQATSELLTRLRFNGDIPWEAITDGTRPFVDYAPFGDVHEFVQQDMKNFLCGYWRDLLQSQSCRVEVLCEKNTVFHMLKTVTKEYQIPISSCRGFNSVAPWHDLVVRFHASGKERLVLIILSDFDPEGEQIPQVGGRTLRDDFGIPEHRFDIVKAGVTPEQIKKYNLPPMNFAKETSSNFKWFSSRNDGNTNVYELEALDPKDMLNDLDEVIRSVLDMAAFNAEIEREQEEAVYLQRAQQMANEALKGLFDDGAQQ